MLPVRDLRNRIILPVLLLALLLLAVALFSIPEAAAEVAASDGEEQQVAGNVENRAPHLLPLAQGSAVPDDNACRLCHADSEATITFPSEDTLSVQVDPAVVGASAHGDELACTSCHARAEYQFPHEALEADNLRDFEIARSETCQKCHQQAHITSHPAADAENAVVCTDCHGAHDVLTSEQWLEGEGTETCVACHTEAGVDFTEPARLSQVIQNGMFAESRSNEYCLSCHSLPDLSLSLDSGEELDLTVDAERFHDSVHGTENPWQALACTDCHEGYVFPHDPVIAETRREYALENYVVCAECHEPKYEDTVDSVHGQELAEGNDEAAVCTDCHGNHYTPPPDEPRSRISQTCRQCHSTIYDQYADSVHGEALLEEDNPDVAVCTDCHGVHQIGDPNLAAFRVNSPEMCGQCHADEQLMEEYDISTEVFDTYVADFHGTTVTLFERQDPTAETNKAVCFDCHGVHDIRAPDDPDAGIKQNMLATCRQCHPDASENFPDAWLSHYQPSLEHHPTVFLVDLFYKIVIPGTVALTLFVVGTDIFRRVRNR